MKKEKTTTGLLERCYCRISKNREPVHLGGPWAGLGSSSPEIGKQKRCTNNGRKIETPHRVLQNFSKTISGPKERTGMFIFGIIYVIFLGHP